MKSTPIIAVPAYIDFLPLPISFCCSLSPGKKDEESAAYRVNKIFNSAGRIFLAKIEGGFDLGHLGGNSPMKYIAITFASKTDTAMFMGLARTCAVPSILSIENQRLVLPLETACALFDQMNGKAVSPPLAPDLHQQLRNEIRDKDKIPGASSSSAPRP